MRLANRPRLLRPLPRRRLNANAINDPHYEVRPRKDKRGITLICDALPFGRLWYTKASDAVDYAKFGSRSHDAVICVYDERLSFGLWNLIYGRCTVKFASLWSVIDRSSCNKIFTLP
jgi:hypothetical protein